MMLLSLTEDPPTTDDDATLLVSLVGGKAASLMKLYRTTTTTTTGGPHQHVVVPKGFALTTDFFDPWIKEVFNQSGATTTTTREGCAKLQQIAKNLPLSLNQQEIINQLKEEIPSWGNSGSAAGLAAVRSSAPEEDGSNESFAGAFETKLGVTTETLEQAIRDCFVSVFDYRVFSYKQQQQKTTESSSTIGFAVVVMEMVDSYIAGVAFSANPLNSDLDEMVIDSSYGLGESVVDGSVVPDHYVYNKVTKTIEETTIGSKQQEKLLEGGGGVKVVPVTKERQSQSSLSNDQIDELAQLVSVVEETYGKPMDVEWAYTKTTSTDDDGSNKLQLKLLQARPITTLFRLDDNMITSPGEPRVLYYDFNIASEATTTTPFTHMDLDVYNTLCNILMGLTDGTHLFSDDPKSLAFNSSTRQYANLSLLFRLPFVNTELCAQQSELLDPYQSKIFASKDCQMDKYRAKQWPEGVSVSNLVWLMKQLNVWQYYKIGNQFQKDIEVSKQKYQQLVKEDLQKLKELEERGFNNNNNNNNEPGNDNSSGNDSSLRSYTNELFDAIRPSIDQEMGVVMMLILPTFNALEEQRREGKTEQERYEAGALLGGYEGDELMECNILMYRLANKLPKSIWDQYTYETLDQLAIRIQENLNNNDNTSSDDNNDLPADFLEEWTLFMERFGHDGSDQLFVSSDCNSDNPTMLLSKLKHNVGEGIKDPAITAQEQLEQRQKIMAEQEERAKAASSSSWLFGSGSLKKLQKRNAILDHVMWMRNAPKLHLSRVVAGIRRAVLQIQDQFIQGERLEQVGDIFHLSIEEVDQALKDESMDLKAILKPRKANYERFKRSTICPILVDSRCRILRPDPVENQEPGTLLGLPISPGVATGKVRVVKQPTDPMEPGEVLVTRVTDPSWTPMFVGATAVILQIGGVMQHGALCAREYGKPAVSGIDPIESLQTGMMVTVDGNTGVVKILE